MTTTRHKIAYVAQAGQRDFLVPMDYLRAEHVSVTVSGQPSGFTWRSPTEVRLDFPTVAGQIVTITRNTPVEPLVEFQSGAALTEDDLNTATRQSLYLMQELKERYDDVVGAAKVRLGENLGIVTDPTQLADQLVQQLLTSDIFDELRSVFDQLGLNTSSILNQALLIGDLGSAQGILSARVDSAESAITASVTTAQQNLNNVQAALEGSVASVQSSVDALQASTSASVAALEGMIEEAQDSLVGANVRLNFLQGAVDDLVQLNEGVSTAIQQESLQRTAGDTALATTLSLIGAKSGDSQSFILNLNTTRVSPTESLGSRLTAISSEITGNRALAISEYNTLATTLGSEVTRIEGLIATSSQGDRAAAEARVLDEAAARAAALSAEATRLEGLIATSSQGDRAAAQALVTAETQARVSALSAEATRLEGLIATTTTELGAEIEAAVLSEATARSNEIEAEATRLEGLIATSSQGDRQAAQAAVTAEASARASAIAAEATRLEGLIATSSQGDRQAAQALVTAESAARTTAISAEATRLEGLIATNSTSDRQFTTAAVTAEASARTTAISAEATRLEGLIAETATELGADLQAAVTAEATARSNEIEAEATRLEGLIATSSQGDRQAAQALVAAEAAARATEIDAEATRLEGLIATTSQADRGFTTASVQGEATARTNALSAEAARLETLIATSSQGDRAAAQAAVTAEAAARASAISSEATRLEGLIAANSIADRNAASALVGNEAFARQQGDLAEAGQRAVLAARVDGVEAAIVNEANVRQTQDTSFAQTLALLGSQTAGGTAFLFDLNTTRVGPTESLGSRLSSISAGISNNEAAILSQSNATASALAALAGRSTSLEAAVGNFRARAGELIDSTTWVAGANLSVIGGTLYQSGLMTIQRVPAGPFGGFPADVIECSMAAGSPVVGYTAFLGQGAAASNGVINHSQDHIIMVPVWCSVQASLFLSIFNSNFQVRSRTTGNPVQFTYAVSALQVPAGATGRWMLMVAYQPGTNIGPGWPDSGLSGIWDPQTGTRVVAGSDVLMGPQLADQRYFAAVLTTGASGSSSVVRFGRPICAQASEAPKVQDVLTQMQSVGLVARTTNIESAQVSQDAAIAAQGAELVAARAGQSDLSARLVQMDAARVNGDSALAGSISELRANSTRRANLLRGSAPPFVPGNGTYNWTALDWAPGLRGLWTHAYSPFLGGAYLSAALTNVSGYNWFSMVTNSFPVVPGRPVSIQAAIGKFGVWTSGDVGIGLYWYSDAAATVLHPTQNSAGFKSFEDVGNAIWDGNNGARRIQSANLIPPSGAVTARVAVYLSGVTGNGVYTEAGAWELKAEYGSTCTFWSDEATDADLAASIIEETAARVSGDQAEAAARQQLAATVGGLQGQVSTNAGAIATLQGAAVYWEVLGQATGARPARVGLRTGTGGVSTVWLTADRIDFGDSTVFHDGTDTFRTFYSVGGADYVRILSLGQTFGTGGLVEWQGLASVLGVSGINSLASASIAGLTTANGLYSRTSVGEVFSANSTMSVTLSSWGVAANGTTNITTEANSTVASVVGARGAVTYQWVQISGPPQHVVLGGTTAAPQFRRTGTIPAGADENSAWQCIATDSTGRTATAVVRVVFSSIA